MTTFIAGLLIGIVIGVVVAAFCAAAKEGDSEPTEKSDPRNPWDADKY